MVGMAAAVPRNVILKTIPVPSGPPSMPDNKKADSPNYLPIAPGLDIPARSRPWPSAVRASSRVFFFVSTSSLNNNIVIQYSQLASKDIDWISSDLP